MISVLALLLWQPSGASDTDEQRELFRSVFSGVEAGRWEVVESLPDDQQALLRGYELWPDLRAAWFRARLNTADHGDVEAFLDRWGMLKPARELRYRYALHLAKSGDLEAFLEIYRAFYRGLVVARLDCIALQAEIDGGAEESVLQRARELWMTGHSQAEECNPVFEHLRDSGALTDADYRARYALAVESREFIRARWLAREIDETLAEEATQWLRAQSHPERFIKKHREQPATDLTLKQLVYAVERVAVRDPDRANELWAELKDSQSFPAATRQATSRHIALHAAYDKLEGAYELLTALPLDAQDRNVRLWRARTSLAAGKWSDLLLDISIMNESDRSTGQWRYWLGVALERTNQSEASRSTFETLASERSFYGFLAADELGAEYELSDARLQPDEAVIARLATRRDLVRARELFLVGLDGRGRSEWDAAVASLAAEEKIQAVVLADRWGWHSRAISTAASIGNYDDLELRYPLPWMNAFETHSSSASIPTTWALGVARSESLFMRDARSGAGAVGLMQLLPSTGRKVAREISIPYSGLVTLTDPVINIRLGTRYLGEMAERYDGNRVLATAAYNAGPRRVDQWLPESDEIDARIWIEGIPFRETREYVRRVMTAETIFHWRLTGRPLRLSDQLQQVHPRAADRHVAAR